ncbi:MAG: 1-acyl-sn-glycerol-3-phosphate acyltransferase [Actinobacteria bacterium]|nr:1-acyl-sn-glycerol-3-phosphate acyltransferase [Actinomycetota bacterium]
MDDTADMREVERMMVRFLIGWPIFRVVAMFYHFRVTGYENVPRREPLLVVANHNSRKDPVAINLALKRPVRFMAKRETFDPRNSLFEYLMVRIFFAYPVDRERPGPEAIRRTLEFLDKGDCVGIFPEGTRHDDTALHPFTHGAAYFAWKTGVQVLPVGITETKGEDYHINIGKPFRVPQLEGRPHKVLPAITNIIREKILELLPEEWEDIPS